MWAGIFRTRYNKRKKRKKRRKHRVVHRHFKKYKKDVRFQHPQARFPRMLRYPRFPRGHEDNLQMLPLMRKMREEYPAPYYNPFRDGSFNPSEAVISWLFDMSIPRLRKKCEYHGLSDEGTRFEMLKRMYLHHRSAKLELGFPYCAYGPEHLRVGTPQCFCGQKKRISSKIKRFPRLPIRRFPRLPRRFPRLAPGLNVKPEAEKKFMRDLMTNDPKRYAKLMKAMSK